MTNDELITMAEAAIKLYEDAGVSGEAGANLIADLIAALKASEARVHSLEDALNEITALRAQLTAAEADKAILTLDVIAAEADRLAAMERVRDAAAKLIQTVEYYDRPDWANHGSWAHACETYAMRIRALDLDALAEGEK